MVILKISGSQNILMVLCYEVVKHFVTVGDIIINSRKDYMHHNIFTQLSDGAVHLILQKYDFKKKTIAQLSHAKKGEFVSSIA